MFFQLCIYLHFSCAIWAEMAGVAGTDIDADKSATLGGYRLCQVKPRAAAYKSHPFQRSTEGDFFWP